MIAPITQESEFEKKLAALLTRHGWEPQILVNPTEEDLVRNWAAIIYNNNRDINRLGDHPLTDTEMAQVIRQVDECRTPYDTNRLISHGFVSIRRDNRADLINYDKTVYLKIFDANEVRSGSSVYQIVRQPRFRTTNPLRGDRRGDVMLLIFGMPLIHIELKRSGVDISQAVTQIKRYTHEGVFSRGIFSLVQIFLAMTPEKTLYFANPGAEENFSNDFRFHWADSNNVEACDWQYIAANLLSIPMAHRMVGQFTIADDKDETLKVLRPYQYYAANAIIERVAAADWDDHSHKGGFVWHTTGSGKTMTSFKSAQLIARTGKADKVVFLLDRIELSTQSADEYRGFANADDNVLDMDDTRSLVSALESDDRDKCLIVTSLQKMSRVDNAHGVAQLVIDAIGRKKVVFIIDECHRSTFGEMLMGIRLTFPRALLFGFTGTPVFEENAHGEITTGVIFGDMLHKYTLANGIPDGNVLGFDLYRVDTFDPADLRREVALRECGVETVEQLEGDDRLRERYDAVIAESDMLKIEDKARSVYDSDEHHLAVVRRIMEDFPVTSHNGRFHAILATRNIPEAIRYYKLFHELYPDFNVAAVFDDNIDNIDGATDKEDAIITMLDHYNRRFGTDFRQPSYARYKKDVAKRLAHKPPYLRLHKSRQINLLIVVTQMLTGYDSKWVNTLYVDKVMQHIDIIQAFSRTNRIFGPEKPFGIIKYFRQPERMKRNIDAALELYVDQPLTVYTDKLEANLENINKAFGAIKTLFEAEGVPGYERLPEAEISRRKFAKEFCAMTRLLQAARMQGFTWDRREYDFEHSNGWVRLRVEPDEEIYAMLLQRYRELFEPSGNGERGDEDVYEIESYITETGVGTIDADYINSKFTRYVRYLYTEGRDSDMVRRTLEELHHVFATLSQRDQRTGYAIIHDIQTGRLTLSPDKTIHDYIAEYQRREADRQVMTLCDVTGMNPRMLTDIVSDNPNEDNINDRGRFDELMRTFDRGRAAEFVRRITGTAPVRMFVISKATRLVRHFILRHDDRERMLDAYFNDGVVLSDSPATPENPENSENSETQETPAVRVLTEAQKRENVARMVMSKLRGVPDWPGTDKAVDAFFRAVAMESKPCYDGLAIDFGKAFDELFAREPVNVVDKHVHLGTLLIRFEVYLKKLHWLMRGADVSGREGREATLADAIHAFPCLWELRTRSESKLRRIRGYLEDLREWRNSDSGNGAHASVYMTVDELDRRLTEVVTVYLFVTGSVMSALPQ